MRALPSNLARTSSATGRRGNATVVSLLVLLAIGSLAGVVLSVSYRRAGEINAMVDANGAFFIAQAGANQALGNLESNQPAVAGSADEPVSFPGGRYWVEVDEGEDGEGGLSTLVAHGRRGLQHKAIEVVVREVRGGPFHSAIFAGNSSGDPAYELELGGRLGQGDHIIGNVYSGGDVALHGDAKVDGNTHAQGSVSGADPATVETGVSEPIPDIAGMNYPVTADIAVAPQFSTATYQSSSAGGKAWQLPEDNPAHIFRKNPDDRTSNTSSTVKDDFFLEDPYEAVRTDAHMDGTDACKISLSGVGGKPGTSSNRKVFFVDGNLWIHNKQTYSFKFDDGGDSSGLQVTFVVKGNIYFSDNLFYTDDKKDGVAFIAMKDSAVADSGNIYLGDPDFGTLERMHAFLYAENNFYDYNLDASGSINVELYGNMTAGNQVLIRRDYVKNVSGVDTAMHTKLTIDFDERISTGELDLPGLPGVTPGGAPALEVLSWREVSPEQ